MSGAHDVITKEGFDAVLFDMDGVLTATATVHAACWKKVMDDLLRKRAAAAHEPFLPFEVSTDYRLYVDGRSRAEGARTFLESRGVHLPYGDPDGPPGSETVCGLASLKDTMVKAVIESQGVEAYEGSVAFVRHLRGKGIKTAVVSSSHHCQAVLKSAGIAHLFDVQVDGHVADRLRLAGKPAPDAFLTAAKELGIDPARAVVIEDAISGVQAGRDGGFALVIGVDRMGDPDALRQHGANLVVSDLSEMLP